MILFVLGMLFRCQHKALTIFRAKGRVLAALRAQLRNAEPVGPRITHTHRAKGQRGGRPPRTRSIATAPKPWGARAPLLLLLDFTPPYPLPASPVRKEVTISGSVHSSKNPSSCNLYLMLPFKCLTLGN